MATRTVTVRLRADISNYTRGMRQAAEETSSLAGHGAAVSAALVAGFAVAAASAAKFDKALSNVRAVSGASTKEMAKLRAAALEAGKSTSYTATEAADAEAELARAGVSVADITGGALKGSLALAASGQLDLAEAATVSAQAMNTFGLKGKDVGHIADLLSAGANKSAADVHGLGEALRQGGLLAHQTGLSIEDTVGVLSAFADHALIGSDAGTSLKTMLQRLTPQSKEAEQMMQRLGFTAYDSTGKFVGLSELAQRLKTSFGKLTPEARNAAMATIFGSDAVRGATILYELGAKGVNKYTAAVDDQGAAARMASVQNDNLVGDLERLRGAIETALIEGGSAANGALRGLTQTITRLVNAYSSLPPELQKGITLFGGLAGGAGLVVAGVLLLLPKIRAVRTELAALGITAERARGYMGMLGRTSLVVAGLMAVSYASSKIRDELKDAPPSVAKMADSLVDLGRNGKASGELLKTFGGDLDGFGEAVKRVAHPNWEARTTDIVNSLTLDLTKGLAETEMPLDDAHDRITALDQALAQLVQSGNTDVAAQAFGRMAKAANEQGTSTDKLKTLLPQYTDALANVSTQSKLTADGQGELGDQAKTTAEALQDQRSEAEKLTDALNALNGLNIGAAEAQINFRQSLHDLTQVVKDNGHSLDTTTEAGRKVKGAYLDAAKAAAEHAQQVTDQTKSQDKGRAAYEADIAALKKTMEQAHFTKDEIAKLSAEFAKVPPKSETQIKAETAAAMKDLEAVKDKVAHTKGKTLTMKAPTEAAIKQLEDLGFKVKKTKGKNVTITVPTGPQKAAVDALRGAIEALRNKNVTVKTSYITYSKYVSVGPAVPPGIAKPSANGNVFDFYAEGGVREQHVAQIAPAGAMRIWAERETGGESYIPLAPSKRRRSRAIAEETVRRLGGKGIAWYARGGVNAFASGGFTYAPGEPATTLGAGTGMDRYSNAVQKLRDAWTKLTAALADQQKKTQALRDAESNLSRVRRGHHTEKQLADAETKLQNARQASAKANATVRADRKAVNSADAALGLKAGSKAPTAFNLKAYQAQLAQAAKANARWESDLAKIGKRAGSDVEETLRGMGEEGRSLVGALAQASGKTFADIVKNLKALAPTAKATLADYTKQLTNANKQGTAFQTNLLKLASMGYGSLATQLAAQGDDSAAAIAAAAVQSTSAAAAANKAAAANANLLSGEDLSNAMTLLGVLKSKPSAGIADVLAAGLDWATVRALAPKIASQIKGVSGSDHFVQQLRGQGVAMARGGILTRPTSVLAAEAGVPESYIPWNGSARSAALLAKTAAALGYRLVPAGRYAGSSASTAAVAREVTRQTIVHLHGAKQSMAEQAADLARVVNFIG